jgi:hypothetical protein
MTQEQRQRALAGTRRTPYAQQRRLTAKPPYVVPPLPPLPTTGCRICLASPAPSTTERSA